MQVQTGAVHPLSRTTLQLLPSDKHYFARKTAVGNAVSSIYQSCCDEALRGKTQYVFNPKQIRPNCLNAYTSDTLLGGSKDKANEFSVYLSDLLFALGNTFPGCDVNYHETKDILGNVAERIISIDWSWS